MMQRIGFAEAARVWARIGLFGFGGPAGQIARMHRLLVEEKKWIGEARFLHALDFCLLLPGAEAPHLAIYLGWFLRGVPGGLAAGLLVVLPGGLALLGLSVAYVGFGHLAVAQGLLFGLRPAMLAVVMAMAFQLSGRVSGHPLSRLVAVAAFLALAVGRLPFPAVVLAAGLAGWGTTRAGSAAFLPFRSAGQDILDQALARDGTPGHPRPRMGRAVAVTGIGLALWAAPALLATGLHNQTLANLGQLFGKMAVVSFGGAYAVLAYVAQQAVDGYRWLAPGEMLDGLALAGMSPGPLTLGTPFIGFLAGFRQPGGLAPLLAGGLGGLMALWMSFLPGCLWIFAAGPYAQRLCRSRPLAGILGAIAAALVGALFHLALWLAASILFGQSQPWRGWGLRLDVPVLSSLDPMAVLLLGLSLSLLLRMRVGMGSVLLTSALAGLLWRAMFG